MGDQSAAMVGDVQPGRLSPRPLRVVLILHDLSRTGAPLSALELFEALKSQVQPLLVALKPGPLEDRCRTIGPTHVVPPWRRALTARLRDRLARSTIRAAIRRWQPDLIYVNSVASLPGLPALRLPDRPMLLHVRELFSLLQPLLPDYRQLLCQCPARIIAVSEAVRRVLVDQCAVPNQRVRMIWNSIPDRILDLPPRTDQAAGPPRPFIVGASGYLHWRKGVSLWLQLAAHLRGLMPPGSFEMRWVGVSEGQNLFDARHMARVMGVADLVKFIPLTANPFPHYQQFDVLALTSLEEPFSRVAIESMALSKPVLCFAGGGGAPEVVGDAGVVIPGFHPHVMAQAICRLAQDPQQLAALGAKARQRIRSHFVLSAQAPRILAEMRAVAEGVATGADSLQKASLVANRSD